jgi:mannose/cellobiose epimerase-like protein (N-acyl-D-glucosamine 2-epimerase family)
MTRRAFLATSAAAAVAGCAPQEPLEPLSLAGRSLEDLKELYRYDLFHFLPFLDEFVIDHERGGFMCNTDRMGTHISTDKTTWYEGRGIWVYSFLYRTLAREERYLEVARKSVELILPHRPEKGLWPASYTREGVPKKDRAGDLYGGLFVANGLAEYARAGGDGKFRSTAKEILQAHVEMYDSPDYEYAVTYGPDLPQVEAPRVLGHWMVLLRLATQFLEAGPDPYVEALADRCLEAILERHYNPDFDLINEVVNHDLSRAGGGWEQFSYTGHAIETLWMVMFEGRRRGDTLLADRAAKMFKRHVEVAWDDVYGGFFRALDHIGDYRWKTDKVLWLQEEVLIGTLFLIEQNDDAWAKQWFSKTYEYVRKKFPLDQIGNPLWVLSGDRKVTYENDSTRVGNFHHPRHLMLNLLALDRMTR